MKRPKIEKAIGLDGVPAIMAKDIPQYVFKIRDKLIEKEM